MIWKGVFPAVTTPFTPDLAVDHAFLASHLERMLAGGAKAFVMLGSLGEGATLTFDEKVAILETAVKAVKGRVPIVAGATSNNTAEAVSRAKEVAAVRGVDAILTASPYYNKPTQEGQYQHFKAIANAVDKPLVLYNVPGRTAANIETATLLRLAKIPNIVAVKEASGSLAQIMDICSQVPEHFAVLSGDDALTLPILSVGGVGLISVASNQIPK